MNNLITQLRLLRIETISDRKSKKNDPKSKQFLMESAASSSRGRKPARVKRAVGRPKRKTATTRSFSKTSTATQRRRKRKCGAKKINLPEERVPDDVNGSYLTKAQLISSIEDLKNSDPELEASLNNFPTKTLYTGKCANNKPKIEMTSPFENDNEPRSRIPDWVFNSDIELDSEPEESNSDLRSLTSAELDELFLKHKKQ